MKTIYTAEVRVLGKNIDTDQIFPGHYLELTDPVLIGSHCLEGVRESFAQEFPENGIIVADTNFGCGSSREHAPIALLNMGASMVIASSFARIFYRNATNLGLPLLECKDLVPHLKDGMHITVNLEKGTIHIIESGEDFTFHPLDEVSMKILEAGGIKPLMKNGDLSIFAN